jgi:tetratricopeptide (TPR) repeat protein
MSTNTDSSLSGVAIDAENPWLGLFSYSEETRAYFHGREEETGELARRVQRKLLTVLFGQSGLGKTSLLQAGIVPRLRAEGFCPIYVRIDYAPDSPPPSEQIKQAIMKSAALAGVWTRPGSAIEGESLWEFLHHRGDLLKDRDGRVLMPLLIFDQFEEIFTLAQADDTGRMRAKLFLDDLADLVENRPPAALESRIEDDDSAAEDFDFARADYRVLIALREDYLAHLEGVKSIMPSITQNRMRLARMTGAQALSAVLVPGGRLVSKEVAESIVRFVAGGSELVNAEIEPSLLSLVCRELNTVRQLQGRSEISADLLAGSRDSILSEFYERTLADQPPGVRRVIEDELLTESGYRESLAEERVIKALAAVDATPDSLATLVNRRLLRIEERLDMRRVELTHDVLCQVVLASRVLRHERESRDEAQRQLAAQQLREEASQHALLRARMIAGICAVLMVIAGAGALFGWVNLQRARASDAAAQKSRNDAEKLVGFLIEDFYKELEPTGQLDTLGRLAHMTVGYYDGLPPELMTPRTQIYRAMAMIREGSAHKARGDLDAADKDWQAAQAVFEKLQKQGDNSEAVTYGLALVLYSQGFAALDGNGRGTPEQLKRAADLLRPLVYGANPKQHTRKTYADILNVYSHMLPKEQGITLCEESRNVLVGLGALDLSNLNAASAYADVTDSQSRHELFLGRFADAQKHSQEVYDMAEKVLAQRPGDLRSLLNRYFAADMLGTLADRRHDDAAAKDFTERSVLAAEDYVRFNPSDMSAWEVWVRNLGVNADLQWDRGEIGQSLVTARATVALAQDKRLPSSLEPALLYTWLRIARSERQLGNAPASEQAFQKALRSNAESISLYGANHVLKALFSNGESAWRSRLFLIDGQWQAALNASNKVIEQVGKINIPKNERNSIFVRNNFLRNAYEISATSELLLGNYGQAEALARLRLNVPPDQQSARGDDPLIETAAARVAVAHAIALQGRFAEAQTMLESALDYYQKELLAGAKSTSFRRDYAYALYVSALSRPSTVAGRQQRAKDLAAADKQLKSMTEEAQNLATMHRLATWIAAAQQS